MPTRNINLTEQMDTFVDTKIRGGEYANASEVIRAGLRALQEDEAEDLAKLEALRAAVQAGAEGPFLDGPAVFAETREYIRNLASSREDVPAGA